MRRRSFAAKFRSKKMGEKSRKTLFGAITAVAVILHLPAESIAQNNDTTYFSSKEIQTVNVVSHNEIRQMREAAMPLSVISVKQLEGTTSNINDALSRTVGIPVLHRLKTHQYWQRWGATEFYRDAECVCYKLEL